ncbi:MAG: hypothetical protein M3145_10315 [Pseudomonadota bacterium]|nr:hypothetical protein [Pseudomonadota bacterium]
MNKFVFALTIAAALALFGMTAESAGAADFILSAAALMLAPTSVGMGNRATRSAPAPSAWQVLPLEGRFEIVYRDVSGRFSIRRIEAQELKVGPGKTLLGGYCAVADGYRGFRADRIERILDLETGKAAERNIIDWLLKRATRRKPARAAATDRRAA